MPVTICAACQKWNPAGAPVCLSCGHDLVAIPPSLLRVGHVLAERYEILSELGSGGMGVVYRAHDRVLDEIVAIKVIRAYAAHSPEMARRFREEIKLARRVGHPNVCRIFEYGEDRGVSFISMQYIDGTDLRALLRRCGSFQPKEACDIGIAVASALEAIHAVGVIHRDLKTVNLMRDKAGVVHLMDFGIAKAYAPERKAGTTAAGTIVGTPEYMSPEQASGTRIDFRSDIYSFGVVLHELVTGDVPFRGETPLETVLKHIQEPLTFERSRVPEPILTILKRALEKRPADRYGTAKELLAALRQAREALAGVHDGMTVEITRAAASPAGEAMPGTEPFREEPSTLLPARRWSRASWLGLGLVALACAWTLWAWMSRSPRVESTSRSGGLRRQGITSSTPPILTTIPELRIDDRPAGPSVPVLGPSPRRSPHQAGRAPETVAPASREIPPAAFARLDQLAAESPEVAYEQALRLFAEHAQSRRLKERLAHYRSLCVARFVENGAQALRRASLTQNQEDFADALRLFDQALDLDPAHAGARHGREEALRFMKEPSAPGDIVSFVQSEMLFTPPVAANEPPGFASAPNGSEIRSAQPAKPRAQLAIEMTPRRLRVGDGYKVRYFLFNRSASPAKIGSVTIKNKVGLSSVTGGSVESLAQTVAPKTRALLLETGGSWQNDPSTRWTTTLTVVLDDGGTYIVSLRSIR